MTEKDWAEPTALAHRLDIWQMCPKLSAGKQKAGEKVPLKVCLPCFLGLVQGDVISFEIWRGWYDGNENSSKCQGQDGHCITAEGWEHDFSSDFHLWRSPSCHAKHVGLTLYLILGRCLVLSSVIITVHVQWFDSHVTLVIGNYNDCSQNLRYDNSLCVLSCY